MRALESILVITDLTRASDACLVAAARLARSSGAELHVFASPPLWPGLPAALRSVFMPGRFARAQARELDAQIARTCGDACVSSRIAHTHVFADMVIAQAREIAAALIVVGGSVDIEVVTAVAARSGKATLVVRDELRWPWQKAVLPITQPVPDRATMAAALWWVEQLHGTSCVVGQAHEATELELVQMAYLAHSSGRAAAAIRAAVPEQWQLCEDAVKVSWRAAPGRPPRARMRDLA